MPVAVLRHASGCPPSFQRPYRFHHSSGCPPSFQRPYFHHSSGCPPSFHMPSHQRRSSHGPPPCVVKPVYIYVYLCFFPRATPLPATLLPPPCVVMPAVIAMLHPALCTLNPCTWCLYRMKLFVIVIILLLMTTCVSTLHRDDPEVDS